MRVKCGEVVPLAFHSTDHNTNNAAEGYRLMYHHASRNRVGSIVIRINSPADAGTRLLPLFFALLSQHESSGELSRRVAGQLTYTPEACFYLKGNTLSISTRRSFETYHQDDWSPGPDPSAATVPAAACFAGYCCGALCIPCRIRGARRGAT
jgi:hypothetical protein